MLASLRVSLEGHQALDRKETASETNTERQTYFFKPLRHISIMFQIQIFLSLPHSSVSSLLPSCSVVTASVSLLRRLSPTSLVASILSLYDVKGFSLQKHTHTNTQLFRHSFTWYTQPYIYTPFHIYIYNYFSSCALVSNCFTDFFVLLD